MLKVLRVEFMSSQYKGFNSSAMSAALHILRLRTGLVRTSTSWLLEPQF